MCPGNSKNSMWVISVLFSQEGLKIIEFIGRTFNNIIDVNSFLMGKIHSFKKAQYCKGFEMYLHLGW